MNTTTPRRTVGRPKGPAKEKSTIKFRPVERSMIDEVKVNHKKKSLADTIVDAVLIAYPDAPGILARLEEAYAKKQNHEGEHRDAKAVSEEFAS